MPIEHVFATLPYKEAALLRKDMHWERRHRIIMTPQPIDTPPARRPRPVPTPACGEHDAYRRDGADKGSS